MNENGLTGFNSERVLSAIYSFGTASADVQIHFSEAHKHLFSEEVGLGRIWCSPNAVDFYNHFSTEIDNVNAQFEKDTQAYLFNICRAYNIVASRHGVNTIDVNMFGRVNYGVHVEDLSPLHASHPENGNVGINRQTALVVLNTYKKEMEVCFTCFEGIPTSIDFYDDEGSQQDAYNLSVESHKEKFIELFNNIVTAIEKAIEEEENNSYLAKQQATQTLNG